MSPPDLNAALADLDPPLARILSAELAAGNQIHAAHPRLGRLVRILLAHPFHECYDQVWSLPDVTYDEYHHPRDEEHTDYYASWRCDLMAPALPVAERLAQVRAAQASGRLLPAAQRARPASPEVHARRRALRSAERLEAALRDLGWWSETPPPPEAFRFRRAFGGDTLSFAQWLQFVLHPRLLDVFARRAVLPRQSDLAAYAARELDGAAEDVTPLISVLQEIDSLAAPGGGAGVFGRFPGSGPSTPRLVVLVVVSLALALTIALGVVFGVQWAARHFDDRFPRRAFQSLAVRPAEGAWRPTIEIRAQAQIDHQDRVAVREVAAVVMVTDSTRRLGRPSWLYVDPTAWTCRNQAPERPESDARPFDAAAVEHWMHESGAPRAAETARAAGQLAAFIRSIPALDTRETYETGPALPAGGGLQRVGERNSEFVLIPGRVPHWIELSAAGAALVVLFTPLLILLARCAPRLREWVSA